MKVALVTDSATVNSILRKGMTEGRFELAEFASSQSGFFEALSAFQPRLIFLRTELAQANGIDVCDRIKDDPAFRGSRVVFLSSNPRLRELAIQHRADRFLTLPFSTKDVHRLLEILAPKPKVILYVDDSDTFHHVVPPALREEGFEVLEAWDGREALEIIDGDQKIDLILSDVEMPEVDGITLCRTIRKTMEEDVPVVLLTSLTSDEIIDRAFEAGADDFVTKPVVILELVSRIKRLLKAGRWLENTRPERILVAEDMESIRAMLVKALSAQGFRVDAAEHGVAALAMLMQKEYDLLLTDFEMPHMTGLDLVLRLRQGDSRHRQLPVIFATSRSSHTDQVKIRSLGIQAFLSKPYTADRMVAEVERVLAEERMASQRKAFKNYFAEVQESQLTTTGSDDEWIADDRFRTLLAADLMGLTDMVRDVPPLEVVKLLNLFVVRMEEVLALYDATIDRQLEESLIVSFGRQEDGAHRAVAAARAMVEGMEAIRRESGHAVSLRVGIHAGHVILGSVRGRSSRRELTLIGDNVRLARRVMELAVPGETLISEATVKMLSGRAEVAPSGREIRADKGAGIPLFRLVSAVAYGGVSAK
ncbi:MAG: response regulator [Magnetococcales bacterium]|nr:response regulator [Magnetococcales bacterium]MBF0155975.1 response regulator [Magnetococcales bacterium]